MYWDDKEKKEGNEFELTEREINIDIQEGNLFIKGIFFFGIHCFLVHKFIYSICFLFYIKVICLFISYLFYFRYNQPGSLLFNILKKTISTDGKSYLSFYSFSWLGES